MDDLLTVKQVAILLKVHALTIRRYINEGKLKAVKVAGNVRISREEVNNFQQGYMPHSRPVKIAGTIPQSAIFQANDPLFRLKGRGLSMTESEEGER